MVSQKQIIVLGALLVTIFSIGLEPVLLNCGYAQKASFTAQLSGNKEVPPSISVARGWAWFNQTGNTIWYKLNVSLIEGNLTSSDLPPVVGFVNKMERGETYVNVHTSTFPTGEIRGQIEMENATMMSNSTMTSK